MTRVAPADLAAFARRYRFCGGRIRRVSTRCAADGYSVEFILAVRAAEDRVRLRLRLTGVEEFRCQKRPGVTREAISEVRFGYFEGLVFINLDAWSLAPGEQPKVHDFRASDVYAAGRELWWELVEKKS